MIWGDEKHMRIITSGGRENERYIIRRGAFPFVMGGSYSVMQIYIIVTIYYEDLGI